MTVYRKSNEWMVAHEYFSSPFDTEILEVLDLKP